MTKIGVLSDTHLTRTSGVLHTLKQTVRNTRTLEELRAILLVHFQEVDLILHAGDFVEFSVLEMLQEIAPVEAVYGNMDASDMRTRLPEKRIVQVAGFTLGLIHGDGGPAGITERVRRQFSDTIDAIIFGHSHQPLNERQNGILFFNPGSPTDRLFAPYNSIGILEISEQITGKILRI